MAAPAESSSPIASAPIPNPKSSYSVDSLFPKENPDHASGAGGYDDHPNSIHTDAPEDGGGGGNGHGYGSWAPSSAAQPLPDNVRKEIPELGFPDDGYNYLLHTREIRNTGCGSAFYQNSNAKIGEVPCDEKDQDSRKRVLLNLPPPRHKVYPKNLFEDKVVGVFLKKQQEGKLKLDEWDDPEDSGSSEDSESDLPPFLLWLRQSFRDLPTPRRTRQALVDREEELKGRQMLKLKELTSSLTTQMTEKTNVSEVIDTMKQLVKDAKLADVEVVQMLWEIVLEQAWKASEVIRQRQDSEKSGKQELDKRVVLEDWEYDSPISALHGKLLRRPLGKLLPTPVHKVGTNLKEDVKVYKNCENIEDAEHRNDKWELLNHCQDDEEVRPASVHQMQNAKEDVKVDEEEVQPAFVHQNAKEDVKVEYIDAARRNDNDIKQEMIIEEWKD